MLQQLEFPGVELIGEGLYVVAPPSTLEGIPYEWLHWPEEGLPLAPLWLLHLLKVSGRPRASKCEERQRKAPERPTKRPTPPDADHLLKEMIQRFPIFGPGHRNAKMHRAVCSLCCRGLSAESVENVMLQWLNHYNEDFATPMAEAVYSLQACVKSAFDKMARGQLEESGTNHHDAGRSWELEERQKEFLERLVYGPCPPNQVVVPPIEHANKRQGLLIEQDRLLDDLNSKKQVVMPPFINKGGHDPPVPTSRRRRLTTHEEAFVECLLVKCAYQLSRGEQILMTDRQLQGFMESRHGIAPSDPDDRKFIRRLRRRFVTDKSDQKVRKAKKRELLVLVKKGHMSRGRAIPSEYEMTGIADAFD